MGRGARLGVIVGLAASAVVTLFFLPPIRQSGAYSDFADNRRMFGVDNFMDVASNVLFVGVGLGGVIHLLRGRGDFLASAERWLWVVFFTGVVLVGMGSGYYHLRPSDSRLFWDRLPMTIAFMSLFGIVIAERVSLRAGLWLFLPLILFGIGSTLFWRWRGDLRPYVFCQFFPLLAVPLLILLFPPPYTRTSDLIMAIGLYALAKLCEVLDQTIFDLGYIVSGHTLKHLVAGTAMGCLLKMASRRRPISPPDSPSPVP